MTFVAQGALQTCAEWPAARQLRRRRAWKLLPAPKKDHILDGISRNSVSVCPATELGAAVIGRAPAPDLEDLRLGEFRVILPSRPASVRYPANFRREGPLGKQVDTKRYELAGEMEADRAAMFDDFSLGSANPM